MSELNLDAIEARANAATEGPWRVDQSGWGVNDANDMLVVADLGAWLEAGGANLKVATFIAAARSDVPALVAHVRELEAVVERVRALHQPHLDGTPHAWCTNCGQSYPCATIRALGQPMSEPPFAETPQSRALTFAADLIESLMAEADSVEHPADGVVRVEVAIDRDEFTEWIVASLTENGLIPGEVPDDHE
jgi:hypothetical protein